MSWKHQFYHLEKYKMLKKEKKKHIFVQKSQYNITEVMASKICVR